MIIAKPSESQLTGGALSVGARGFDRPAARISVIALAIIILVRPKELNFLRLLPFIVPLLCGALFLASRSRVGLKSVRVPLSVLVMVSWFVTTTVWSGARAYSLAESCVIVGVSGIAALVATSSTLRTLVGGTMIGCLAILVMSVTVALLHPAYGLVSDEYEHGALQGVLLDRNSLGFVLVIGLMATLTFEFRGRWCFAERVALAAAFLGGVIWTKSATSLILAVIAILLAILLTLPRQLPPRHRWWGLGTVVIVTAGSILYVGTHLDKLLKVVDRDSTFTGRTQIWPAVREAIASHPWLGHGWGGVWGPTPIHQQINRAIGFEVPHAHNGYLDAQVQVGEIGLILLLVVVTIVAIRGVGFYMKSDSSLSSWPLIFLVIVLVDNRVETTLAVPSTLFLLVSTLVVLTGTQRSANQAPPDESRRPSPLPRPKRVPNVISISS